MTDEERLYIVSFLAANPEADVVGRWPTNAGRP
jgi:hypothetical protein